MWGPAWWGKAFWGGAYWGPASSTQVGYHFTTHGPTTVIVKTSGDRVDVFVNQGSRADCNSQTGNKVEVG